MRGAPERALSCRLPGVRGVRKEQGRQLLLHWFRAVSGAGHKPGGLWGGRANGLPHNLAGSGLRRLPMALPKAHMHFCPMERGALAPLGHGAELPAGRGETQAKPQGNPRPRQLPRWDQLISEAIKEPRRAWCTQRP